MLRPLETPIDFYALCLSYRELSYVGDLNIQPQYTIDSWSSLKRGHVFFLIMGGVLLVLWRNRRRVGDHEKDKGVGFGVSVSLLLSYFLLDIF